MGFLVTILVNTVALLIVDQLFTSFHIESLGVAILASVVLAILNAILKPILIVITLPITILTLGLFLIVINAITLMVAQAIIGSSFIINGFGTALLASILISIINMILGRMVKD